MTRKKNPKTKIEVLSRRLEEAEALLSALKKGEVDAFVTDDHRVFTLEGTDYSYRVLIETMSEGAATLAKDGTIMYCNKSLSDMLGLPIEKVMGSSIYRFIDKKQEQKLDSIIKKSKIRNVRSELKFIKPDESILFALVSCNALKLTNTGICMVLTDVTEHHRNELELKKYRDQLEELVQEKTGQLVESEKKFRLAFENAEDAIIWADPDTGIIVDCNPSALKLFEKEKKEIIGTHQTSLHPTEDVELAKKVFKEQSFGLPKTLESRIVRKSGDIRSVSISASLMDLGNKRIIQGIFRDITEQKKAEELLRKDKKNIEIEAKDKTDQLVQAKIALERGKRLSDIGVLAATVAHELRNPLATIGMAASNIKRKTSTGELDSHIKNIENKIAESNQIINNLLFYSRLKLPSYERIDIYHSIKECVDSREKQDRKRVFLFDDIEKI
ncbi:MAG TPA: PAS domain S-box protein, partial [Candidatus Omnitrophota bacterium]|nr:PAS domain S-box protein [Candidatus Omnitrophota bacterium]